MCPQVDDDIAGTCEERCTNDSDCSAGEMCCSNGCGHVCMAPMSTCEAVLFTVSNQSLIGSFQPQCDEDGSFSRVQCHGSTGHCWCVDPESGQLVSDQVRFKQPLCNCTYDGVTHYAGESFPAGDGCNKCHCTMDGGVKCTELDVPCAPRVASNNGWTASNSTPYPLVSCTMEQGVAISPHIPLPVQPLIMCLLSS